jgi:hypothetical protein
MSEEFERNIFKQNSVPLKDLSPELMDDIILKN